MSILEYTQEEHERAMLEYVKEKTAESMKVGLEKGMEDALERAFAFAGAGADAIMIHSRKKEPTEIFKFVISNFKLSIKFCCSLLFNENSSIMLFNSSISLFNSCIFCLKFSTMLF